MLDWSREVEGEGRGRRTGGNITDDQKFVISVGREESSERDSLGGSAAPAAPADSCERRRTADSRPVWLENFRVKKELKHYEALCAKQEEDIVTLKKAFDQNLLTISKQLELLQQSLATREAFIKKQLKRKDKVIMKQKFVIKDLLNKSSECEAGKEDKDTDSEAGKEEKDTDSGVVCTDNTDTEVRSVQCERWDRIYGLMNMFHRTDSESSGCTAGPGRRVFLNHRNITRMKDVKYKRISKTKSKSMEELRDKLR